MCSENTHCSILITHKTRRVCYGCSRRTAPPVCGPSTGCNGAVHLPVIIRKQTREESCCSLPIVALSTTTVSSYDGVVCSLNLLCTTGGHPRGATRSRFLCKLRWASCSLSFFCAPECKPHYHRDGSRINSKSRTPPRGYRQLPLVPPIQSSCAFGLLLHTFGVVSLCGYIGSAAWMLGVRLATHPHTNLAQFRLLFCV